MAIDLYFVGKCKDFVSLSKIKEVSFGWGLDQHGNLRRPKEWIRNVPIVIDDSIPDKVTDKFLQMLLPYCEKGCILDFERKLSQYHLSVIRFLNQNEITPIWIPANYSRYAVNPDIIVVSDLPHNSWKSYCAAQKSLYGTRWVLEYHPVNIHFESVSRSKTYHPIFLDNALCMAYDNKNSLHYYDTSYTITTKLKIAEEYGCQGVLAIGSEWEKIK